MERRRQQRRSRRRSRSYQLVVDDEQQQQNHPQTTTSPPNSNSSCNSSSESEMITTTIDRSSTLKIRLNPMDFEYFTSVVRSEDELAKRWQVSDESEARDNSMITSNNSKWEESLDERTRAVQNTTASQFELSLMIIQLIASIRESPAMRVLKFALDTLWSLEFVETSSSNNNHLDSLQCAKLKASVSRLMLTSLGRALESNEASSAIIHNGLLPMTLRLLEAACTKTNITNDEEGSLIREFVFSGLRAVLGFLHYLLEQQQHQRANDEKIHDFVELFQLFAESQDGRLIERAVLTILELPSVDPAMTQSRAAGVIDMLGSLITTMKRARQRTRHSARCRRVKHKNCPAEIDQQHHHLDALGTAYFSEPAHLVVVARASLSRSVCSVSVLFASLAALLKLDSRNFTTELQLRIVRVMSVAGTCCCFPAKYLLASVVNFLEKCNAQCYPATCALLEKTIFKELGGYASDSQDSCNSCSSFNVNSWDFVELYSRLLAHEDNVKLCRTTLRHLLKVTGNAIPQAKHELLFRVFYPTFLKAKQHDTKFVVQSCLSAITSLIVNPSMFSKFAELNGLEEVLGLLPNQTYVKSAYALLEISVVMEIKEERHEAGPAAKAMFMHLEKETNALLMILQSDETDGSKRKSTFHQAGGVWRATAGVVLSSPKFRPYLMAHPVIDDSIALARMLAIAIATDNLNGK